MDRDLKEFKETLMKLRKDYNGYLDSISTNFISYINTKKEALMKTIEIIESILDYNSENPAEEAEKHRQIDLKMNYLVKEINNLFRDLLKFQA